MPVGPADFSLELLLTISASPFGSIVFKSLPFDLTGPVVAESTLRPLAALGRFIAGAWGNGAQSCEGGLLGVEVADGRNEAGISDPVGKRDWMILGNGRREGRVGAIPANVESPAKEGVLLVRLFSCTPKDDLLPCGGTSHTELGCRCSYIRCKESTSTPS